MSLLATVQWTIVTILVVVLAGCGVASDPLNRQAVSGHVTFKDQPLDDGSISFDPQDRLNGRPGGATVSDGKFALERERGLPPGIYTVRINSADASVSETVEAPGITRQVAKERIPTTWNSMSEQTVTVVEGEENHFELAIP